MLVCTQLRKHGINAVLSGGACVSIYADNRYKSSDLDFIEIVPTNRRRMPGALLEIGFVEKDRYFANLETDLIVEFPAGPLAVGSEPVREIEEMEFPTGRLALLSPADCVKDGLAAYYCWNDRQSLAQALLVAEMKEIDLKEIRRWSGRENKSTEFRSILTEFVKASRKRHRS